MSTATAAAPADAAPAPKSGKKKLIIIIVVAVVVLALAAVGALLLLKKKAQDEEDMGDEEVAAQTHDTHARDPKAPPTFVPLDMFTVNLADKEAERYAQVGITLELSDPAAGESIKTFMPAIRNNILMVLAHKTAAELLERDGKTTLAEEIRRETARGMGLAVADAHADDEAADEEGKSRKKRRKKPAAPENPVAAVYFSNFIIQ